MEFVDRKKEYDRLQKALVREKPQFIVIYGRRRIGKSTLIKKVMDFSRGDVYFLADRTSEPSQRQLFATTVDQSIEGFSMASYPTWESLFLSLNRSVDQRITVCLDEFPYLVKSCPALPSILQKLLDDKKLKFDLIICGSSQQMMQGFVLDSKEPLYGRADEIMRMKPIAPTFVCHALHCDAEQAVREYAVWGGVPRYWELRSNYDSLLAAIDNLLLTPEGTLYEEPSKLLYDEMRDTVQASSILSFIGNGANKLSEIASRAEKQATDITSQLSRLKELGFINKEIPFGESEKKSKKGLYHISDPLLRFHYRYVLPYRSLIELGNSKAVLNVFSNTESEYTSQIWEKLCRNFISTNGFDGIMFQMASRWWGSYYDEEKGQYLPAELDVVAESFDGKHLFLGECKWQEHIDAKAELARLKAIAKGLHFAKDHEVHYALFLREFPKNSDAVRVLYPENLLAMP
ncbi:MAG: ATP-binding protein [Bacteroidaceae bacterium]|nr:ATP-binding protein [Bacteroidaceae bacterium]MBQ9882834.1 ATP-binding protein [Bacteroidaceae bacterium]